MTETTHELVTSPLLRYVGSVRLVEKPWGHELIWALTDRYCGKLLLVREDHALSLQLHERKDETLYLQSGLAEIEIGESADALDTALVSPGAAFRLQAGTVHRVRALEDCVFLEVSTPELDDVVRLEDRYGRA
jgi:mannose-6-phosphate isomerase-like protein (cupin superfamily)